MPSTPSIRLYPRGDYARPLGLPLPPLPYQTFPPPPRSRIASLRNAPRALRNPAFFADRIADAPELLSHLFVLLKDVVQRVINFSAHAGAIRRQAHVKIAVFERHQRVQQLGCVQNLRTSCFRSHSLGP